MTEARRIGRAQHVVDGVLRGQQARHAGSLERPSWREGRTAHVDIEQDHGGPAGQTLAMARLVVDLPSAAANW
jgi:hypothetical protein